MLLRKGNASQGHGKVSKWSWRTPRDKSVSYCRKLCVFISKYLTSTRGLHDSVTALFLTTNSFVSRYIAKYFLLPYRDHNKLRGKKSFTSKSMWIMVIHQADQRVGFFPPLPWNPGVLTGLSGLSQHVLSPLITPQVHHTLHAEPVASLWIWRVGASPAQPLPGHQQTWARRS